MPFDAMKIQELYQTAKDNSSEWRTEGRELYDLLACRQWTEHEESELKERQRIPVVLNRIAPFVDSIVGQQINNRKEIRYLPRETSDNAIAELYTEAAKWADDLCDGEDEVTDAFHDLIVTGMGWTETRMDYSEDPDGRLITAARIDPLEMYWDVNDLSRNLSKSKWRIRARKYPAAEAESRWPKIKNVAAEWTMDDDQMRQPHDSTTAWKYENDQSSFFPQENMYLVLQVQYYEDKKIYRVADPESGQVVNIPPNRFEKIRDYLDAMGVRYISAMTREYRQAFVCGHEMLEDEVSPTQAGFTINCMTGKRDRNRRAWYGVVRALKDPQKFSNKFFSDFMHILATNRKGGAFVESDALEDPRQAEEDWASPDALIRLNPGGLQKVRERDSGIFPAGLDRMMQYALDAVPQTSGMSPEMVGLADRNQPGILEAQRKQSGLTILAPLFDALKRHQRARGRVVLDLLDQFIADGRAIRITAPDGGRQSVPFFPAPDAKTYDIIVDEAPTTPNSKQETFAVLSQLVPFMAKMGVMPPPEVLDYLPLPQTLIEKWRDNLKQGEQEGPDPAQQLEMMKSQAKQQEMQAKAQMDMLKMEFEREKIQLSSAEQQNEAMMREREQQFEAQIKNQEAQIKAAELELKRAELAIEANNTAAELAQSEVQNAALMQQMNEVMQGMADTMGKSRKRTGHRATAAKNR